MIFSDVALECTALVDIQLLIPQQRWYSLQQFTIK